MNQVSLVGRLVADPELKYTESGKARASFVVAVNQGFGEKKTTEYIDCVAWEKAAEKIAEQGRKGKEVSVMGRISVRKWVDREGAKRKSVEVVASTLVIGGGVPDSERRPTLLPPEELDVEVDDIPF